MSHQPSILSIQKKKNHLFFTNLNIVYRLMGFMTGQGPLRTVINIKAKPIINVSLLRSLWALSMQARERERVPEQQVRREQQREQQKQPPKVQLSLRFLLGPKSDPSCPIMPLLRMHLSKRVTNN